ncbi:MAG: glycoside hydrolase family 16 protein [Lachnospiraceae bacterium]|nr:glycoside hydrolase family 16 protein [Lachnospiraceae bacterium]
MNEYKIANHEPSFLPEGKEWSLVWSDEFDGTELDTSKWDYRLSMMGTPWPAWTDKGVHLDGDSNAVFTLIEEDGRPVSSQLQTGYNFMDEPVVRTTFGKEHLQWNIGKLKEQKFTHKYGYYECRCRLQQKEGWWSAFWIQSPIIGASLDPTQTGSEIDVMESFFPGEVHHHNVFTGGYGLDMKNFQVGGKLVDEKEFHRFGVLWDESGYTFYVDGVEDGHIDSAVSGCPQFILISTEPRGYRMEHHQPTEEAFAAIGDTFVVDYVRVFDMI